MQLNDNSVPSVIYDKSLRIVAVSPSAWMMVAPTQWFSNYSVIATVTSPLSDRLRIIDAQRYMAAGHERLKKVSQLYESVGLLARIERAVYPDGCYYLMDRPVSSVQVQNPLVNSYELARRFENKVWFRQHFADRLRFPDFRIVALSDLHGENAYARMADVLSPNMVVQHDSLGGGRGTCIVSNKTEFVDAVRALIVNNSSGQEAVVSAQLCAAQERTVQACVLGDEVLIGPAQAQLVGHQSLTSSRPGDMQFCGGRIKPGLVQADHYAEMVRSAKIIGQALQREGYRGIFGVDFLIQGGDVYVLEVNPRMTGLTPLLAYLQREVPFLLLHILELAHATYTVDADTGYKTLEGSFIEIYAQTDGRMSIEAGLYDKSLRRIGEGFENGSMIPSDKATYFVATRVPVGEQVSQGKSLAFVYSSAQLFDDNHTLEPGVIELVERFQARIASS